MRWKEKNKRKRSWGRLARWLVGPFSILLICCAIYSSLHSYDTNVSPVSELKAAIVDQLSLTTPNQTFFQTATITLEEAGYTVDYYKGEDCTVEFYRNLPTHGYGLIILRVHSSASGLEGTERVEGPVVLFTSEPYSGTKYVYEQLTDQIFRVSYNLPEPPYYFAITPTFVTTSMRDKFQNTVIVMMGCEGLKNTKMAEAFVQKGAKVYISWKGSVLASYTDQATTHLLQHLVIEKQTIKNAIAETMKDVGKDPAYNSPLNCYPLEAEDYTTADITGNLITNSAEIKHKIF